MIRDLTTADLPQFLPLGLAFLRASVQSGASLNEEKVRRFIAVALQRPDYFMRVAEVDGAPAGFFLGNISKFWFSDDLVGKDIAIFVHPDYRGNGLGSRMARQFVAWCQDRGARLVVLANSSGILPDSAEKVFRDVGGERVGGVYVVESG